MRRLRGRSKTHRLVLQGGCQRHDRAFAGDRDAPIPRTRKGDRRSIEHAQHLRVCEAPLRSPPPARRRREAVSHPQPPSASAPRLGSRRMCMHRYGRIHVRASSARAGARRSTTRTATAKPVLATPGPYPAGSDDGRTPRIFWTQRRFGRFGRRAAPELVSSRLRPSPATLFFSRMRDGRYVLAALVPVGAIAWMVWRAPSEPPPRTDSQPAPVTAPASPTRPDVADDGHDDDRSYVFRIPSGEPTSLSCEEARTIVDQVRAGLAYAPERI